MTAAQSDGVKRAHGLPFGEFVGLMAALMAVNALGIDMMLPALPHIAHDLNVTIENHQQWVVAFYIGGFGVAQLVYGPLADRFGRRPIVLGSLILYAAMSFLAAFADSFPLLLAARALQGISAAATRVLTVSIVRDCYAGRRMARVTSLAFTTFLAVPVFAPMLGQAILLVAPWHWIFDILGIFSLSVAIWAMIRLPETLDPALRRAISVQAVVQAGVTTLTNRYSIGYALASACIFGSLMGFINSSQQILSEVFGVRAYFGLCFGLMGLSMSAAALTNSRIVERFGTRMVSHSALIMMILVQIVRLSLILSGHDSLPVFMLTQAATMFCFGLCGPNFGAMAMEEMGHIAGTASSFQGFLSTCIGTLIGLGIGQNFQGSTFPLAMGFLVCSSMSLIVILIVERGKLMRAHFAPRAASFDAGH